MRSTLLIILLLTNILCASDKEISSMTTVESSTQFHHLWAQFFNDDHTFPLWNPTWTEEEVRHRFQQLNKERFHFFFENAEECLTKGAIGRYKPTFDIPDNWAIWNSRYPYPLAFSYNLAMPSYCASLIVLNDHPYLAMEAPSKANLDRFLQLLQDNNISLIVRLTPTHDGPLDSCYPYWEGRDYTLFSEENWIRNQVYDPHKLLHLVKETLRAQEEDQGMLAVHCRGGCGRTGTFLAALALIQDIDTQLAQGVHPDNLQISIEKLFWQLSLQRPFCIAVEPEQYLTLYHLISLYLKEVLE